MYAEKQNGAISRRVSVLNQPVTLAAPRSSTIFTGEIRLFAGASSPPFNWLICNGSVLSRIDYSKLFNVIGTLYGTGVEDETHFRLPDLHGRVPIGVDEEGVRLTHAKTVGTVGGETEHALKVDQLPLHDHGGDNLTIGHSGNHTHGINDPGHTHHIDHGLLAGYGPNTGPYGTTRDQWWKHVRPDTERSLTDISINSSGSHGHEITGRTGSTGGGQTFSLIQPFQTLNYIIYVGN
jgi:microcystin-dependent protein